MSITKKDFVSRIKSTYVMDDMKVLDAQLDKESEILTVIAISKYHNVYRFVWYYEPDDDTITYLDGVSGLMTIHK